MQEDHENCRFLDANGGVEPLGYGDGSNDVEGEESGMYDDDNDMQQSFGVDHAVGPGQFENC